MSTTASASDLTVRGLLATEPQMAGDKNHVLRFSIRKNSRRQRSHPTYVNCKAFGDTADQLHKTLA
jgi:single-stranded DNA-binding protein